MGLRENEVALMHHHFLNKDCDLEIDFQRHPFLFADLFSSPINSEFKIKRNLLCFMRRKFPQISSPFVVSFSLGFYLSRHVSIAQAPIRAWHRISHSRAAGNTPSAVLTVMGCSWCEDNQSRAPGGAHFNRDLAYGDEDLINKNLD